LTVILCSLNSSFSNRRGEERGKLFLQLAIALPSSSSDFRSPTSVLRNEVGGRRKEMRIISVVGDSFLFQFLSPLEEKREKRRRLLSWRSLFHQAPPLSVLRFPSFTSSSEVELMETFRRTESRGRRSEERDEESFF